MHELLSAVVASALDNDVAGEPRWPVDGRLAPEPAFVFGQRCSEGREVVLAGSDRPQSIPVSSLYERIGGDGPLLAAVDGFYKRVVADDRVNEFFKDLTMEAQVKKQLAFMAHAMGGPNVYRGRDLGDAHRELVRERGLNDEHFDVIVGHLRATLEDLGLEGAVVDEVAALIETTRSKVLGREGGGDS